MGNITDVTNALGLPVGRRSGAVSYRYGYDELYRLTSAQGQALARPGLLERFTATFQYSDIHNMLRNVQVRELVQTGGEAPSIETPEQSNHDYIYQYGGAGPHQATQIGDTLYTYDGNGNTLTQCRAGQGRCGGTAASPGGPPGTQSHDRSFTWTEENWRLGTRLTAARKACGRRQ